MEFGCNILQYYPELAKRDLDILIPFPILNVGRKQGGLAPPGI